MRFSWRDQAELDALFELEERVDRLLHERDIGEVDGNEIGEGTYVLFTVANDYTNVAKPLIESEVDRAGLHHLRWHARDSKR